MSKELINRTEELSLLGWSQDGAQRYSELIDNSKTFIGFSEQETLLSVFLILLILVFGSILIFRLYQVPAVQNSSRNLGSSKEISSTNLPLAIKPVAKDIKNVRFKKEIIDQKPLINVSKDVVKGFINLSNKAVDYISLERSPNKPFLEHFSNLFKETSINTDSLIEHGLLATLLTYEASRKAINSISSPASPPLIESVTSRSKNKLAKHLANKSDSELRNFLKGSKFLSGLQKDKLIELILINPEALEKVSIEVREAELKKKTVVELKSLLQGEQKISRLRKSELIERVLLLEYSSD